MGVKTDLCFISFLFMLFIAMDANFRMKQRVQGNTKDNHPLGAGLGHLVDEVQYLEHLKNYTLEKDVCMFSPGYCIADKVC